MLAPKSSSSTGALPCRSQAFDEIEALLKSRIRELEEQRHDGASRSRTFSELVKLLANLERVDELRELADRVGHLRNVDPLPGLRTEVVR